MNVVTNEAIKSWSVWAGDLDFGIIEAIDENEAILKATLQACNSMAQALDTCGGITEEEYRAGFVVKQV